MKYELTYADKPAKMYLEYTTDGYLKSFKNTNAGAHSIAWYKEKLPCTYNDLLALANSDKNYKIMEITQDLSFENFWNTYGYKVGGVDKCRKIWDKMTGLEKQLALNYIPKLRKIKKDEGTAMPYPTTYLNQKYWKAAS